MTENTESVPASESTPKKSNRSTIVIAIMAIVIIVQGVKIFLDSRDEQVLIAEKTSTEQELAATLQRMNEIKTELDAKIEEVKKLGGDVSDLEAAKTELDNELKRNKRATGKEIKALKDRVEGFELLLKT
jgi:predicted nuclease with TOPRIM domain